MIMNHVILAAHDAIVDFFLENQCFDDLYVL